MGARLGRVWKSRCRATGLREEEDWDYFGKVTVMSCTHKLRGIKVKVGFEMSLVGGTEFLRTGSVGERRLEAVGTVPDCWKQTAHRAVGT